MSDLTREQVEDLAKRCGEWEYVHAGVWHKPEDTRDVQGEIEDLCDSWLAMETELGEQAARARELRQRAEAAENALRATVCRCLYCPVHEAIRGTTEGA